MRQSGGKIGGVQGEGGIGEDDIARGTGIAMEDGFGDAGILGDIAAEEGLGRSAGEFEGFRGKRERGDGAVANFKGVGDTGGGDFVEAVFTVDDEAAREAKQVEGFGNERGGLGGEGACNLDIGAGGVGERAEVVKQGARFQLGADGLDVAGGPMEEGREEEGDAVGGERGGGVLEVDAERFEEVGTATEAGEGAVAVFGDAETCSGGNEGGDGGDVEGTGEITAGAAGVEERFGGDGRGVGGGTEGAGGTGQFVGSFAFQMERDEESGDLGFRRLAFENGLHGEPCFLFREMATELNQGT